MLFFQIALLDLGQKLIKKFSPRVSYNYHFHFDVQLKVSRKTATAKPLGAQVQNLR